MPRHIETYNHKNEIGVLVEFHADDDFSFRTEEFKNFARDIALHIAANDPAEQSRGQEILSLLNQKFVKDEKKIVRDYITDIEQQLTANIKVVRYCRYSSSERRSWS